MESSPTGSDHRALRVVGAAILEGRRCLAAQRSADSAQEGLKWEFPGGKIEVNETPEAALEREIREELAVEIEVGPWLGRGRHVGERGAIELDVYLARVVDGDLQLLEHRAYGWFGAEDLDSLDWASADRPILPALKQLLERSSQRV